MAQEYLLTTNDYKEPKVLSGKDAIAAKLLLLMNMIPGTNRLHLEMGIDLPGRYRFCSEDDLDDLETEIQTQIETYLPEYSSMINIKCQFNDEGLIETAVQIDDTVYGFDTNEEETKLSLNDLVNAGGDDDIPEDAIDPFDEYEEEEFDAAGVASNTLDTLEDQEFPFENDMKYGETPANIVTDDSSYYGDDE